MAITRDEVKHIAELAYLELKEEEVEMFTKQLGEILDYVHKLEELDTRDVDPTHHVVPMFNVMREDVVKPSLSAEDVTGIAPESEGNFVVVPRVIE
ncbi:MAG: Asp-tRNA(Asn)/Glu-tRNA(Gln) amidotransferase subunit GatC [bacterium]